MGRAATLDARAGDRGQSATTEAQTYFFRNPWLVAWPGLVLVAILMSASFSGDGLRDALDPPQG